MCALFRVQAELWKAALGAERCQSQQGSGAAALASPSWSAGFLLSSSRVHCSSAVQLSCSALLVLLSALLLVVFIFIYLFPADCFQGNIQQTDKEPWGCPAHRMCKLQLRWGGQELLLPQTEGASCIPPVGILSHCALPGCAQLGMGEKGAGCARNPSASSTVLMDSWQISVPNVVSSYLRLWKFPTLLPSVGNSLSNSKHLVKLLFPYKQSSRGGIPSCPALHASTLPFQAEILV